MSWKPELEELAERQRLAEKMGGDEKVSRQHGRGKLDARARISGIVDDLTELYKNRQFEKQLGAQDEGMRLALNFTREIKLIASEDRTEDSMWFGVMGQPPVRTVFEKALGLPESFASIDLDAQLRTFRKRASDILGTAQVSQFSDPERVDDLLLHFFARTGNGSQAQSYSSASIALTLLQGY